MTVQAGRQAGVNSGRKKSDRKLIVTVSPNKLTAEVRLSPPAENQPPVSADDIKTCLGEKNIIFGIDDDAIENLVADPVYDQKTVIARGIDPISGKDARLNFNFETVQTLSPKEDEDGRIDYKDINFVQRAEEGQVLVEKIPATKGTPGTDVFGKPVSALSGSDVRLPAGINTSVSDDGLTLLAAVEGSIVYANKHININKIHTIGGNVCIKTGNIEHNGSLIIRGMVESGFEVKARGDVEIFKNVADARVITQGNIMVKGGFSGNHNGLLQALGNIHCKYVDDQVVISGDTVEIGGEAYNSLITGRKRVIVKGSKGRIVGGKIMAGDEIRATCLGSDAGTRTELLVAYNPDLMRKYHGVIDELKRLEDNVERVKEGLYIFYRQQMDGELPPGKLAALKRLEEFNKDLPIRREELLGEKEELEAQIQKNKHARIIALQKVYPGVILHFGIVYREMTDELGPSYFQLSGGTVTWTEYKSGQRV